jgi:hypothetical protein
MSQYEKVCQRCRRVCFSPAEFENHECFDMDAKLDAEIASGFSGNFTTVRTEPGTILLRLTRSQQMALVDVLIAYIRLGDQPQEFDDVLREVTTGTGELLHLIAQAGHPEVQTGGQAGRRVDDTAQ